MTFQTIPHEDYRDIDLHTKKMYLCIIDQNAELVLHKNITPNPNIFMITTQYSRKGLVVRMESVFSWYRRNSWPGKPL